jgi:NAD(P)-dependent dehydrogenase (short-subunit alcohol dehydrogenase family)
MSDSRNAGRGPVVITGASTGIGAATSIHLAKRGFLVFAGVRRQEDGEALRARARGLIALRIDVTDAASVSAAAATVEAAAGDRGLAGLVNNAGIVKPGPIEFQPMADIREQLEVNLFGQIAVLQAFLPLIRRGHGRIVNIGSIGGRLAPPLHGAYSASKFGIEALSDALRLELRQWNIPVSLVEPGATRTAIFDKELAELDALGERLGPQGRQLYASQIAALRRVVKKAASDAASPGAIASAVDHALTASRPKARYLAGHEARLQSALARSVPDGARDWVIARTVGLRPAS